MIRFLATLVAAVALAAGYGCGAKPDAPGGTLTIARRDSFATFDPAFAWNPETTPFLDLVFEGLVAFDDSGRVRPACAGSWSVSEDGRTYQFALRPGLRYADGSALIAGDFVSGFRRLFRPGALRSPGAVQFVAITGALRQGTKGAPKLGVDAPDERTVVVHLEWPDPFLLEKLAQPRYAIPVPESASARKGVSYGAFPSTNGPYAIARAGRDVVLFVRNRHYAAASGSSLAGAADRDPEHRALRGNADTIRVLTNRTARQALLGIESGRVDALVPPPLEYRDRLLRSARFTTVTRALDPPIVWYLGLNAELAPLARRDARRAVAWAVNRQRLTEELGTFVQPARAFQPWGRGEGEAPGYDPLRARQYLESAKYYTGIRVQVVVPRGSLLSGGLEALAPAMARASIQAESLPLPAAAWERTALERRGALAILFPWQSPAHDGVEGLTSLLLNRGLASGWGGNWGWLRGDGGLDSLLLAGLRQSDPVERQAASDQLGTLLESESPFLPLARVEQTAVVRTEWTGVRIHPRNGLDLRRIARRAGGASP